MGLSASGSTSTWCRSRSVVTRRGSGQSPGPATITPAPLVVVGLPPKSSSRAATTSPPAALPHSMQTETKYSNATEPFALDDGCATRSRPAEAPLPVDPHVGGNVPDPSAPMLFVPRRCPSGRCYSACRRRWRLDTAPSAPHFQCRPASLPFALERAEAPVALADLAPPPNICGRPHLPRSGSTTDRRPPTRRGSRPDAAHERVRTLPLLSPIAAAPTEYSPAHP
jgi:hypothetical protein